MEINAFRNETIELTQELVRASSLSGMEKPAAELLARKFRSMDFDEVSLDRWGSVMAVRKGTRPGKTVLWDAHLDVVDYGDLSGWTANPLSGEIRDGKLWGRGSTDIKGGLAAMAVVGGRIPRDWFSGTLVITGSVGEEKFEGCGLENILKVVTPQVGVICEPTGCRIGIGHKGRTRVWIEVPGRSAHSSRPELGDNAIYKGLNVVNHIRQAPSKGDGMLGERVIELVEISSRPFPGEFTVPYGCRLVYDIRLVRGETQASLLDSLRESIGNIPGLTMGYHPVELKFYTGENLRRDDFHPGWCLDANDPFIRIAAASMKGAGLPEEWMVAPYCTNASLTAGEAGIPTLLFGPSHIQLAHIVDEYVEMEQLDQAVRGLIQLARSLGADQ